MFCAFVMRFHLLRLLRWLLSSRVIYGERIQEHACLRRKAVFFVFMPIFKIFSSAGGGATALFTNKWFPFSFPFSSLNFPHSALNRELTKRRRRRKNLEKDFYSSLLRVGKPDMRFGRKRKKKVGGTKNIWENKSCVGIISRLATTLVFPLLPVARENCVMKKAQQQTGNYSLPLFCAYSDIIRPSPPCPIFPRFPTQV